MTAEQRAKIAARAPYETDDGIVTGADILAIYDAVAEGIEAWKGLGLGNGVCGNSNRRVDYSLARLKAWKLITFDKATRTWKPTA